MHLSGNNFQWIYDFVSEVMIQQSNFNMYISGKNLPEKTYLLKLGMDSL